MLKDHRHEERMRQVICKAMKQREPVSLSECVLGWTLIGIACAIGAWGGWLAFVYVWAIRHAG